MTQLLSLRQAAKASGLSMHTLLKAAAIGQIRTIARVGEWPRFSVEDARRYVASMKPPA